MGTPKMRTFTILASLAALAAVASPAAAEVQIRVSIVGKDAKTIQTDIRKAAEKACTLDAEGARLPLTPMRQCVAESVQGAMQQVPMSALADAGV
jgi:hypothetical protein